MSSLKLAFLDLDGCVRLGDEYGKNPRFSPECLQRVIEICEATGARIVISSDLVNNDDRSIKDLIEDIGAEVSPYAARKFASLLADPSFTCYEGIINSKPARIARHLERHPTPAWIVIDDVSSQFTESPPCYERLIAPNNRFGLQESYVTQAIGLLGALDAKADPDPDYVNCEPQAANPRNFDLKHPSLVSTEVPDCLSTGVDTATAAARARAYRDLRLRGHTVHDATNAALRLLHVQKAQPVPQAIEKGDTVEVIDCPLAGDRGVVDMIDAKAGNQRFRVRGSDGSLIWHSPQNLRLIEKCMATPDQPVQPEEGPLSVGDRVELLVVGGPKPGRVKHVNLDKDFPCYIATDDGRDGWYGRPHLKLTGKAGSDLPGFYAEKGHRDPKPTSIIKPAGSLDPFTTCRGNPVKILATGQIGRLIAWNDEAVVVELDLATKPPSMDRKTFSRDEVELKAPPLETIELPSADIPMAITRLATMLGMAMEPGWHIDDLRPIEVIDRARERIKELLERNNKR